MSALCAKKISNHLGTNHQEMITIRLDLDAINVIPLFIWHI